MAHRGDGLNDIFEHNVVIRENCTANKFIGDGSSLTGISGGGIVIVAADPATSTNGTLILNTSDNKVKIWYDGRWQTLHTLTIQTKILMETGDFLLLETGDKFLTE